MGRLLASTLAVVALSVTVLPRLDGTTAAQPALAVEKKFDLIRRHQVPPGSNVAIGKDELNAYVRAEAKKVAPEGIRDPRLELGTNRASGFALIDFPKLRQAQGKPLNWFMARLLAGERRVRVDAHIRSGSGKAVVDLDSVEISGITIRGNALDYLIRNFLWTYYPNAQVGRPFELAHRIDRLEVRPTEVQVIMAAAR